MLKDKATPSTKLLLFRGLERCPDSQTQSQRKFQADGETEQTTFHVVKVVKLESLSFGTRNKQETRYLNADLNR